MLNLALGVRAVHKHRFIHRELSPKSVFVDVEGDAAIITSFELAKMLADEAAAQKEIPTVFTRRVALNSYRAPEIEISPHDVSYTADIYSWGAIYFRLITGHQFRNEPKAFARLAATNCKQAVISLVEKCLEADPSDRPRDMEEVITSVRENLTYRRDVEI
jgi:serine/threonine protein kinase